MTRTQPADATSAPTYTPEQREAQRIAHLVLGAPRPKITGANRRRRLKLSDRVVLAPGIEERVQLREDWSHKAEGTPETHAHADRESRREGALARLVATGAIDAHQLAAAEEIALAHQAIVADVSIRTAKLEPRGSTGGPDAAAAERIGAVIRDRAYSAWREHVAPHAAMLLAIIVDDVAGGSSCRSTPRPSSARPSPGSTSPRSRPAGRSAQGTPAGSSGSPS